MKYFETTNSGHTVVLKIYVKADGRTVCVDDKEPGVAELKYGVGERITEAQKNALIFPEPAPKSQPVPDAEQRSAEVLPDAEVRNSGARKRK